MSDMSSSEINQMVLEHHQRLGAKWGVHNGPPYPLRSSQLTAAERKEGGVSKSAKIKYGEQAKYHEEVKKDIADYRNTNIQNTIRGVTKNSGRLVNEAKNIDRNMENISKSVKRLTDKTDIEKYGDASEMSDTELRDKVKRLQNESNYYRLMKEADDRNTVSVGKDYVREVLEIAGSTVALATSVGTLVLMMKKIHGL